MSSYHNQAIEYRPEIDGLRAVAVLPVILYHAGFELFSGGYTGVDVFFVISGYLITSIILRERELGKFSILKFYERRAKRILPALFFIVACCLPFAWIWMLPDELKRFGQSMLAVATFSSNIYFWRNTDYFAPAAEEQPLLHTWSLAIEEQYYVIFPLFLMFCWRFGKTKIFWLTAFVAALSLALTEWGWRNAPSANFYLLPTRAWELLAGSLLALIPKEMATLFAIGRLASLASLLGLGLIIFSIFSFDSSSLFPSVYTLAPVLGAVLIIVFASSKNIVGRILSTKVLVAIGLISYSAYLWHQPIFAFLRIRLLEHPSPLFMALGAISSVILAYVTWRFVEQPFRSAKVKQVLTLKCSALGLVVCVLLGVTINLQEGFPERYSHIALPEKWGEKVVCHGLKDVAIYEDAFSSCLGNSSNNKPADIFLIGDSHAAQLSFPLRKIAQYYGSNFGFINTENNESIPFGLINLDLDEFKKTELIEQLSKVADDGDYIIITFHRGHFNEERDIHLALGSDVPENQKTQRARTNLEYLIESFASEGVKIVLIQDVPLLNSAKIHRCIEENIWNEHTCGVNRAQDDQTRYRMDKLFNYFHLRYSNSVTFIELSSFFYSDRENYIAIDANGKPTYIDSHHITEDEALRMYTYLINQLGLE